MELLGQYSAWLEIYSIDEPFLGVNGTAEEHARPGHTMKTGVRRNEGVRVCVGIAGTKTLAKLANKWAKRNNAHRASRSPRSKAGTKSAASTPFGRKSASDPDRRAAPQDRAVVHQGIAGHFDFVERVAVSSGDHAHPLHGART
ncbi:hypothetical protein ABIB26_004459 [Arthrobacter sp. UYEF20]